MIGNTQGDLGLQLVRDYLDGVRSLGDQILVKELAGPIIDICANTATVGLFQPYREVKLMEIKHYLEDGIELMKDMASVQVKKDMQNLYPVMYTRLDKISKKHNGNIPGFVKQFYARLIKFTLDFYDSCQNR